MIAGVPSLLMFPAQQAPTLPLTAWEQAVILCIFAVILFGVLFWMARENRTNREFQAKEAEAREKAQEKRDQEWRDFLERQRSLDQQMSEGIKQSLDGLTDVISSLAAEVQGQRSDFQTHDQREWAKLDEMSATIHAKDTAARRKKGVQG